MGYWFDVLRFPAQSRLNHLTDNTTTDPPQDDDIATGHLVALPGEMHVSVADDFLSSHLPFKVCAFGGVYPDESPFVFITQKAPATLAAQLAGEPDPFWTLRDSLHRALSFTRRAHVVRELRWSRDELLDVYEQAGVERQLLSHWPVADLLRGLLAECCRADLARVVRNQPTQCAFPGTRHVCQGNVFSDVYSTWAASQGSS